MCPRCGKESIELGVVNLSTGRTRKMRSLVKLCPECALIFYEKEF